jgi:hypothetical protein
MIFQKLPAHAWDFAASPVGKILAKLSTDTTDIWAVVGIHVGAEHASRRDGRGQNSLFDGLRSQDLALTVPNQDTVKTLARKKEYDHVA